MYLVRRLLLFLTTTCIIRKVSSIQCPSSCTCSLTYISCNFQSLTSVPPLIGAPNTPYDLHLMSNPNLVIRDDSFSNITLRSLDLKYSNNMSISDNAFKNQRKTLKVLDISNAKLKTVPRALKDLDVLENLRLRSNNIQHWDFKVMERLGVNLTELDISNNGLTYWPRWLRHMWSLKRLDVSRNAFGVIPRDAFNSFHTSLQELNIKHTETDDLPIGLQTLHALKELRIGGPSLNESNFHENWLPSHKSSLTRLEIENAKITKIPPGLRGQRSMTTLMIRSCNLRHVHEEDIPPHLTELDLSYNKLTRMYGGMCNPDLKYLFLGDNNINSIEKHDLDDCQNVSFIILLNNNLDYISPSAFSQLPRLSTLYLQDNKLIHIPSAIQHLHSLSLLVIDSNPLECTCQDKWIQEWRQTSTDQMEDIED